MDDEKQSKLRNFYDKQSVESYSKLMNMLAIGDNSENRNIFFEKLNIKNADVLEIGVGQGANLKFYKEANSFLGVDISEGMLEKCNNKIKYLDYDSEKFNVIQGDARKLEEKFVDKFDHIILTYALSGSPNQNLIMKNVIKYCRKGGKIAILDSGNLFKSNIGFFKQRYLNFIGKISSSLTGFSNQIDPWEIIFNNRKDIEIVVNEKRNKFLETGRKATDDQLLVLEKK